jgi:hypothetical protein
MVCAIEELGLQGTDQGFAVVLDRSSAGVRIWTPQQFTRPASLLLRINVGETIYELPAMLRWKEAGAAGIEAGVAFVGSPEVRAAFATRVAMLRDPGAFAERVADAMERAARPVNRPAPPCLRGVAPGVPGPARAWGDGR